MIQSRLLALKAPVTVLYEVTPVCNHDCTFCYAVQSRPQSHPPLKHVQAILDQLVQAEVCQIKFTGGEFLLHPTWEEILARAQQQGFYLSFISNGSKLTEEVCNRLKDYMQVGAISLHGPNAAVHDGLTRRKGSFAQALKAMLACQHNGLPFAVLYTPTRDTCHQIWDMARTLAEKKVMPHLININRLTPHGCALERWESIRLDLQHYLDMFEQAARIKKDFGIKVCVGDGFPLCQIPAEWREFAGQCEAGVALAAVGHQGLVRLCTNSAGNLGNLLHTPLQEIWTNAELMSRLRKLDWLPTQCKTCSSASVCKSGCMVSQPNVEHFSCDAILPSNTNLAEQQQPKQVSPPGLSEHHATVGTAKESPEIMYPKFSRRYRIRQDILGPLVVLDNGRWFFIDSVGQAVLELCDGRHTRANLCHHVAAQLNTAQDEIRGRVNGMLDLLIRWGLCEEGDMH